MQTVPTFWLFMAVVTIAWHSSQRSALLAARARCFVQPALMIKFGQHNYNGDGIVAINSMQGG